MATQDLGTAVRNLRRAADLSQRELAHLAGVPKSTVTRLEAGTITNPAFRTVEQLVAAAGGSITISPPEPREAKRLLADLAEELGHEQHDQGPVPHGGLRDRAGRRYPAHLDARATYPMFGRDGMLLRAGTRVISFELDRDVRDDRRAREAPAEEARIEFQEVVDGVAWQWTALVGDETVGWLGAHLWPEVVGSGLRAGRRVALCRMEIHRDWGSSGLERRLVDALRDWRDDRGNVDVYSFGLVSRDLSILKRSGFYPATEFTPRMLKLSAK